MSKGYIYVLSNPGMPGVVKIGRSINGGKSRASEIYGTGIPAPFNVEFDVLVEDCKEMEKQVHDTLSKHRVNPKREFFKVEPIEAIRIILDLVSANIGCITVEEEYFYAVEGVQKFASITGEHPFIVSASLIYLPPAAVKEAIKEWGSRHATHSLKVAK